MMSLSGAREGGRATSESNPREAANHLLVYELKGLESGGALLMFGQTQC
jgi:hypothetical protein